jgi:hypothetical protein
VTRVDIVIPPAYDGGGDSVAVSVTVPEFGVSSVVGVGGPAGGRFWSLVCALGVV